jgi:hypothetical protein
VRITGGSIHLFHVENGQVFLNLDRAWSGFITTAGQVRNIVPSEREARQFPLSVEDYGSICLKDLRLLYRLAVKKPEAKTSQGKAKGYGSRPLGLFLANEYERRFFGISMVMALLFVGLTCYSLLSARVHRPSSLEDLGTAYILPFVDPEHLKLVPETLQTKLDRSNYLKLTIWYYRALSASLSGWFEGNNSKLLKETTVARYEQLHDDYRVQMKEEVAKQASINDRVLQDRTAGLIFIPSVLGESIRQRLIRILDKVDLVHQGLRMNLLFKRRISKQFGRDETYDWLNYHASGTSNHSAQEYLSKVRVFSELTNEQQMYAAAEGLAREAQLLQQRKFGQHLAPRDSAVNEEAYIQIDSGVDFVSFVSSAQMLANDEKIGQIRASSFDKQRKEVIREPLVGEIDPSLIQKALSKNQFQLQLCYELALRRNQSAQGSMDWQWRIDSRGKISDIVLKQSSIGDHRMVECVRSKMAMWQFPRPRRGSIEVNHSFQFSPRKG